MDSISYALIVESVLQKIACLLATLQAPSQAPAAGHFEVQGLLELLLQTKSHWEFSGYLLCVSDTKFHVPDREVVEFQQLINQARMLFEAIRCQTPLHTQFASSLERGHISELVFQDDRVRKPLTVASEHIRVLNDLVGVYESMAKSKEVSRSMELPERKSFETDETVVDTMIRSSPPSSLLSTNWQKWTPRFRWQRDPHACIKTRAKSSVEFPATDPIIPKVVCQCRTCITEAERRSKAIDIQLQKDGEHAKRDKVTLLLGFRESTDQISKLLLRFDKDPYTTEELEDKKSVILRRTYEDIQHQLEGWHQSLISRQYQPAEFTIEGLDDEEIHQLQDEVEHNTTRTVTFQQAMKFADMWARHWKHRSREFHDHFHFLNNIARITSPSYTPTEADVSHLPLPGYGTRTLPSILHQSHSTLSLNITRYDQRSRLKRLIYYFSDTSAIIFPIDLTHYIIPEEEIPQVPCYNPIQQGIITFTSIADSRLFKGIPIFLWFGNVRKFKAMIAEEKEDMTKYIWGWDVGNDGDKAVEFVKERYLSSVMERKNIFVTLLDALDVEHAKKAVGEMGNVLLGLPEDEGRAERDARFCAMPNRF